MWSRLVPKEAGLKYEVLELVDAIFETLDVYKDNPEKNVVMPLRFRKPQYTSKPDKVQYRLFKTPTRLRLECYDGDDLVTIASCPTDGDFAFGNIINAYVNHKYPNNPYV